MYKYFTEENFICPVNQTLALLYFLLIDYMSFHPKAVVPRWNESNLNLAENLHLSSLPIAIWIELSVRYNNFWRCWMCWALWAFVSMHSACNIELHGKTRNCNEAATKELSLFKTRLALIRYCKILDDVGQKHFQTRSYVLSLSNPTVCCKTLSNLIMCSTFQHLSTIFFKKSACFLHIMFDKEWCWRIL